MGERGPAGKHPDRRHGHGSKASREHDVVPAGAALEWPPVNGRWPEPVKRWYRSLRVSGQAVDYVQSDADFAYLVADQVARDMRDGPLSAAALNAFLACNSSLLATAGSRRRAGLEISREQGPAARAHLAAVESLADRRRTRGEG